MAHFSGIVFKSFTCTTGSNFQGYLAVGGKTTIAFYSISSGMPKPSGSEIYVADGLNRTTRKDFVVCGDLLFTSGAVMGGGNGIYTGVNSDVPSTASAVAPGRMMFQTVCPVDFADAYTRLKTLSIGLASYVRTGTAVVQLS